MSCFFSYFFFSFHFFCNTVNCACYWPRRPLASQSLTRFTTGERKREIAPATAFHQALLVSVVYTVVTPVNTKEPGEPARAAPAGCQQHQQRLSFVGNVLRSIQKSKKEKKSTDRWVGHEGKTFARTALVEVKQNHGRQSHESTSWPRRGGYNDITSSRSDVSVSRANQTKRDRNKHNKER